MVLSRFLSILFLCFFISEAFGAQFFFEYQHIDKNYNVCGYLKDIVSEIDATLSDASSVRELLKKLTDPGAEGILTSEQAEKIVRRACEEYVYFNINPPSESQGYVSDEGLVKFGAPVIIFAGNNRVMQQRAVALKLFERLGYHFDLVLFIGLKEEQGEDVKRLVDTTLSNNCKKKIVYSYAKTLHDLFSRLTKHIHKDFYLISDPQYAFNQLSVCQEYSDCFNLNCLGVFAKPEFDNVDAYVASYVRDHNNDTKAAMLDVLKTLYGQLCREIAAYKKNNRDA